MFGLFKAAVNWLFPVVSPLTDEERDWLRRSFQWLRDEFGVERLNRPVILPTDEFFPDPYDGKESGAAVLLDRVCKYMDVDRSRLLLQCYQTTEADVVVTGFNPWLSREYALGAYEEGGRQTTIWLETTNLSEPESIVGTLAHELGHVHLLGGKRVDQSNPEHEPLTDLLMVYFGMGIFGANSAVTETNWKSGQWSGWSISKNGYLSMAQYAYALALYALARDEASPPWARYLRPDVKAMMGLELANLLKPAASGDLRPTVKGPIEEDISDLDSASDADVDGLVCHREAANAPDTADDFFSLGVACAAEEDHEGAIDAFSRSLELEKDDAEIWVSRAKSYLALKEFAKVVSDCNKAVDCDHTNPYAYCYRGEAYIWLGQYEDAIADLNTKAKTDEALIPLRHFLKGIVYYRMEEYETSLDLLCLARHRAPTWAEVYLARGRVYESMGNLKQSEADYAEAIRRDPRFANPSFVQTLLSGTPIGAD